MLRLAVASGIPPSRLLKEWTSEDIALLKAYTLKEPWGEFQHEYYTAKLCSLMATLCGNKARPIDFMRTHDETDRDKQVCQDMHGQLSLLVGKK